MIHCDQCGQIFKYAYHLEKHLTRKVPCYERRQGNVYNNKGNVYNNKGNVNVGVNGKKYACLKCEKQYCNKKDCKTHEAACDGCHALQCPVCRKMFASRSSKCTHRKNVVCTPYVAAVASTPTTQYVQQTIINNTYNNNIIINWSNETYDHLQLSDFVCILKKNINTPISIFSELPMLAHRGEHANLKLSNIRGNYVSVHEDGRFVKKTTSSIIEDSATKFLHRLDDVRYDDSVKVTRVISELIHSLVQMEDIISGQPVHMWTDGAKDALIKLQLKASEAYNRLYSEMLVGLWNATNTQE